MNLLKGKNVLITGGAGFIGSNLADRIICENPAHLTVVDNFFLGNEENLKNANSNFKDIRIFRLDASDLASMHQLVETEKIEIVFNLAVVPLPTSLIYPEWTVKINITIPTVFCELARWGCIQTLIHCSSSEAYGSAQYIPMDESHPEQATTPYAASKAGADQIVLSYRRTFGIDTAIARPFNNFGPRQNPGTYAGIIPIVINRVQRGKPIEIFGDGLQTRDFIFVNQTAEAMIRIYGSESTRGRIINVSTGQEITINNLVSRMVSIMGVPHHPIVHTAPRPGDVRRHCGDIRLLRELTGYEPSPITDENLRETIDWYQRSYRNDKA